MSQCLIAANWKLNGNWQLCQRFVELQAEIALTSVQLVICPPAVYLQSLSASLSSGDFAAAEKPQRNIAPAISIGAQNVAAQSSGAFTGELSAAMLAEVGAHYCIVGHSERRAGFGETDTEVAIKSAQLLVQGLTPIICVGEDLAQRESDQALTVIEAQLIALADVLKDEAAGIVIAYEPIWAIGTGQTATPQQAQEVHEHIRKVLGRYREASGVPLLYGGSVNPGNAQSLLAMPDIDGALVGGASLDPEQLMSIVRAAELSSKLA